MTTITPELPTAVRKHTAQPQRRAAVVARATVDAEARTVELAFASEAPYERWFGTEILSCVPGAVDLSRLNNRHPLLLEHDRSQQIGVIESARVDADRVCRCTVRFSRSALAEEILQDVVDGIRELISVGYQIDDMVLESRENDHETYRVSKWTPFEVSIVSIPADTTVGVGRSLAAVASSTVQHQEHTMTQAAPAADTPTANTPDIRVIESAAITAERERSQAIRAMGAAHQMPDLAEAAVADGSAVEKFMKQVLDTLQERGKLKPATPPIIGLSEKEKRQYSIQRLMYAMLEPHDREAQKAAGLEIEASVAARKLAPVDDKMHLASARNTGFRIPMDVMSSPQAYSRAQADALLARLMQRDLTVGTPTAGGNLVATDLLAASFIDLLRNRMVLSGLGVTMLDGLAGNVAIPSQTAGASTYWVTEGNAPTESQAAFGQVTLTPKTVGMITDYTRKTLLQTTPAIEMLIRADLAAGIAVEADRVGLNGSGSGAEPRGINNTAGIGAVAGGTNGAVPTYEHMVQLEEAVAIANADIGSLAYVTNPKMRAKLKLTQLFASTNGQPVWNGNEVNGYRTAVTNNQPSNLTKGTASGICSAITFGNWADLLYGFWSGLDLILDPYALATSGGRRLIVLQDMDVAARRAASFAAMLDALRS